MRTPPVGPSGISPRPRLAVEHTPPRLNPEDIQALLDASRTLHQYRDGTIIDESQRAGERQEFKAVTQEVLDELDRAAWHFPPMRSPHEGAAIVQEEWDEMWNEVKANRPDLAIEEAIQLAAMAIRFVHDIRKLQK